MILRKVFGFGFSGLSVLSVIGLVNTTFVPQANAGRIEPISVPCWHLQEEQVKLRQTCTYSSVSWTGGYQSGLKWQDGVVTRIGWGLVGRGEKPCGDDYQIDGSCGTDYYRHPKTLKRLPKNLNVQQWIDKNRRNPVKCIQAFDSKNSVCWVHPY